MLWCQAFEARADANEVSTLGEKYLRGLRLQTALWGSLEAMFSYLDAGTGSMIITAVAGGFAGLAVAVKMGLARLRSKVTGKPLVTEPADDESENAHD